MNRTIWQSLNLKGKIIFLIFTIPIGATISISIVWFVVMPLIQNLKQ